MAEVPGRDAAGGLETGLDRAHARMRAAGETEAARRGFFAAVAATELFVVLEEEPAPGADRIRPLVLETGEGALVLAFDSAERMAAFLERGTPMAALPGRDLCAMLLPAGLGLGLNLEVAPSATLLPPEAVEWIAGIAPAAAEVAPGRVAGLRAPGGIDPALLEALAAQLARLAGQAAAAHLAQAAYAGGGEGLLLVLVGVPEPARAAASAAVAEALALAGLPEGALDLAFAAAGDPLVARIAAAGLSLEIPAPARLPGAAPGSDPQKPPRLL